MGQYMNNLQLRTTLICVNHYTSLFYLIMLVCCELNEAGWTTRQTYWKVQCPDAKSCSTRASTLTGHHSVLDSTWDSHLSTSAITRRVISDPEPARFTPTPTNMGPINILIVWVTGIDNALYTVIYVAAHRLTPMLIKPMLHWYGLLSPNPKPARHRMNIVFFTV